MSLKSAVYVGVVRHRRREPAHAFKFPLFMVYLDLAELDRVLSMSRWWGRSRWCPARFRREDYLTRGNLGIADSVRQCVFEQLGRRTTGPIRMLTHMRYFGYTFNPVTFYYCFDEADGLSAIVAEITNTPWKERHSYVLDVDGARGRRNTERPLRWRFGKEFHVSPFLPMDMEYDWTLSKPDSSVLVHMNVRHRRPGAERAFDATLRMDRRELTPGLMRGLLIRYPLMTLRVIGRIHLEALRLWLKQAKVYKHPKAGNSDVAAAVPFRSHS